MARAKSDVPVPASAAPAKPVEVLTSEPMEGSAESSKAEVPEVKAKEKPPHGVALKIQQTGAVVTALTGLVGVTAGLITALQKALQAYIPAWLTPVIAGLGGLLLFLIAIVLVIGLKRKQQLGPLLSRGDKAAQSPLARTLILTSLGICLLLALPLTISLYRTSIRQDKVVGDLLKVASVHSTEYVGAFPDNMDDINKLVSSTQTKLTILVDFPGYGRFSKPAEFAQYTQILNRLSTEGKQIKIKYYGGTAAHTQTFKQFDYDPKWPQDKKLEYWQKFCSTRTYDGFCKFWSTKFKDMESLADSLIGEGDRLVQVDWHIPSGSAKTVSDPLPLFAWIVDDERAIVSYYNLGPKSEEAAFLTINKRMIEILNQMFESAK